MRAAKWRAAPEIGTSSISSVIIVNITEIISTWQHPQNCKLIMFCAAIFSIFSFDLKLYRKLMQNPGIPKITHTEKQCERLVSVIAVGMEELNKILEEEIDKDFSTSQRHQRHHSLMTETTNLWIASSPYEITISAITSAGMEGADVELEEIWWRWVRDLIS